MAGSVRQRGKESWRLSVSLGVGADGKYIKKEKTVKAKNKTAAKVLLAEFVTELESGEYIAPSHMKFGDYVEVWRKDALRRIKNGKLTQGTLETYNHILKGRILPFLSHYKMENISHILINDFIEDLEENELATSTIQKHYTVLNNIFKLATKNDVIKANPMDKVDKPTVSYKPGQVYTPDELKELYHLLSKEENKQQMLLVKVALKTGMRKGEILALRKNDLDFSKNIIHIRHSLGYTKEYGIRLKETKTKGSNRKIGVPVKLMKELKKHIFDKYDDKKNSRELWEGGSNIYVFSADLGTPFFPGVPGLWWTRFLKRTGFKKIRFHDMRHTFATGLINKGGNINKISKYLGHASINTTSDIYGHLIEGDREIADMLEEDYI